MHILHDLYNHDQTHYSKPSHFNAFLPSPFCASRRKYKGISRRSSESSESSSSLLLIRQLLPLVEVVAHPGTSSTWDALPKKTARLALSSDLLTLGVTDLGLVDVAEDGGRSGLGGAAEHLSRGVAGGVSIVEIERNALCLR